MSRPGGEILAARRKSLKSDEEMSRVNTAARGGTTFWKIGVLLLVSSVLAACGGNSTTIGIVVSAPGISSGSTATIITNGTLQFTANVTGISTNTVYWRICLPAASVTI